MDEPALDETDWMRGIAAVGVGAEADFDKSDELRIGCLGDRVTTGSGRRALPSRIGSSSRACSSADDSGQSAARIRDISEQSDGRAGRMRTVGILLRYWTG